MKTLYVITGPTATGKTELGVRLCEAIGGEVVSADSMQIYQHMDIGTAKPAPSEMRGVPHHIIAVASPFENYSVSRYVEDATRCCEDVFARGRTPVLVGGTGLYIESLLSGRDFAPMPENTERRGELSAQYDELGGEKMLERLAERDPERARKLHPNDKKRIVRALEISESGRTISGHDERTRALPPRYAARTIVLDFEDRQALYDRIDRRVELMLERGLVDEVRRLLAMGLTRGHTAMQAIGYKEIAAALEGRLTMAEAVETVKRESRRYAKRQISWCKRYEDALRVNWKNTPDFEEALRASTKFWGELG